jgi:hypothetical protein
MNERGLATALTLNGAFNNVVAEVASGADRRAVMAEMDRILRNLERKPWQAFFTALGLAFATGIPIVPGAIRDGIAYLSDFQWGLAQGQDVTLGIRTLAALFILREEVLKPLLAGLCWPKRGRPPKNVHPLDIHYQTLQRQMRFNTSNSPLEIPVLSTNMLVLIDRQQGRTDDCGLGGYR